MDLKELEKEIREREMDNDIASLFIIRHLLSPPVPDMLGFGGKRDIFRRFKKFLEKIGAVPRQLELIFDVAFTFLEQAKKIINIVKPKKLIYLAIDGVCPRAKIEQQRKRRFKSRNCK